MGINPLNLPPQINVPQIDFTPIGRLGQQIGEYRRLEAEKQAEAEAFSGLVDAVSPRRPAASMGQQDMPQAGPRQSPAMAAAGMPRGLRNNNPGNIEDGPFAKTLPGYKGSDGRFAVFETPDHGLNAMDQLLTAYGRRGVKTVGEVIGRWAPKSDGNDVDAYARFVGGDPNKPVDLNDPQQRQEIAKRMAMYENGMQSGAPREGTPQAAPQPGMQPQSPAPETGLPPAMAVKIKALFASGSPRARDAGLALLQKYIGKQEPIHLKEGESLIDPATYQPLASGPSKRTSVRPGGALVDDKGNVIYQAPDAAGKVKSYAELVNERKIQATEMKLDPADPRTKAFILTGHMDVKPEAGDKLEDQVAARKAIVADLGMNPNDPQTKIFIATGKHPGEDKVGAPALKAIMESEDENNTLTETLRTIGRAKELNSDIYTGFGAGLKATLGTKLPTDVVPDSFAKRAQATEEWQKLMEPEALNTMTQTLKGATTDFELRQFRNMLADPSVTPQTRLKILDRMERLATGKMGINTARMDQLRGGSYTKPGGGQSRLSTGGPIPDGAIAELKSNPSQENRTFFDQTFGTGAASRVLGGK